MNIHAAHLKTPRQFQPRTSIKSPIPSRFTVGLNSATKIDNYASGANQLSNKKLACVDTHSSQSKKLYEIMVSKQKQYAHDKIERLTQNS